MLLSPCTLQDMFAMRDEADLNKYSSLRLQRLGKEATIWDEPVVYPTN
jgi:hypothetical protein